jgi:GNAT superfamily N-acetyltransferase
MKSPEYEPAPRFEVMEMTVEDIEPTTEMRLQSWLDTYVNEAAGVTYEWVAGRNEVQRSTAKQASRVKRFTTGKQNGTFNAWVAKDQNGTIIGASTPFVEKEGRQRLGSLYVDKEWNGRGVGSALIQKAINWLDPSKPIYLEVVSYNKNAQRFYAKWGFEKIPDTDAVFEELIPEFTMIRKAQNEIQS